MIRFACPGCSATFTVGDEKAGKTGKCPKCQTQFTIPEAAPAADAAPPPMPPPAPEPPPLPSSYVSPPPPPPSADDPVEIAPCPGCGARLSVLPSDLGQDVECPSCKKVYRSTRADAPPPPNGSGRTSDAGYSLAKLGSGARSNDDDDDDDRRPSRRRSSRRRDDDDDDDDDRPRRRSRRRRSYDDDRPRESHRGGMILAFGIIGFFCIIFAILAWVMGQQDIQAMDNGRMDEEGRGTTNAGKICGMIAVLLKIVIYIGWCGLRAMVG